MSSPIHVVGGLDEAIIDLEAASRVPAKSRITRVSILVDRVCSIAFQDGVPDASLRTLVDLLTLPNELDQASRGKLVKNLYPSSRVADAVVIRAVGSLGHGRAKPAFAIQAALLKWLIMVYDVLENPAVMSRLYGILFNLLDTIAIRSQLCHLLSLITRRKHVRPYRIQVLMELTRQAGNDPPLVGLMRVYKDYYPDIIVGDTTTGRASVFTPPNLEWRERLREIQDVYFQKSQEGIQPEKKGFRVTRRTPHGRNKVATMIPEVHTSRAQESSITLEEIENVSDFVRQLEKIELPNQLVAVIGDPLLQKFLQLKSSEAVLDRIDQWLVAFFEDQLQFPEFSENFILPMLTSIRDYTRYTKKLPQACLAYLEYTLDSWNGVTGREVILGLLEFTPIGQFSELYRTVFQNLEAAILEDQSPSSKLTLLKFYTNLLKQWTVSLLSQPHREPADGQPMSDLINHSNSLSLTILQSSTDITAHSTVLYFYESTASLFSIPELRTTVRITTPATEIIYTLYFTQSLSTLSRLCYVLSLYKRAFEVAMSTKSNSADHISYPKENVNRFNGFLMDICNCIWRSRAFNAGDLNALGCLLPASIVSLLTEYVSSLDPTISLPSLFNLSMSPLFSLLAISFVRGLEDKGEEEIAIRHAGPVTQASLKQLEKNGGLKLQWGDYRLGLLRYLENKGVAGVGELMYNTLKHLMTARENMA